MGVERADVFCSYTATGCVRSLGNQPECAVAAIMPNHHLPREVLSRTYDGRSDGA